MSRRADEAAVVVSAIVLSALVAPVVIAAAWFRRRFRVVRR